MVDILNDIGALVERIGRILNEKGRICDNLVIIWISELDQIRGQLQKEPIDVTFATIGKVVSKVVTLEALVKIFEVEMGHLKWTHVRINFR